MAAALLLRPFLPVDETRYLAVAWEMWLGGDYLVPHLNGETYSHKPPLLFWLMNGGWMVFGVNDWWPRLVAPLFGLASLFLTGMLARRLWPGSLEVENLAPIILFGALFWTLFTTLTMFDMILTCFALMGMLGIVMAWRDNSKSGFTLLGLAIGFGILAKGPAILLSTLPVALLAPFWSKPWSTEKAITTDTPIQPVTWSGGWKQWYANVGLALLLGVVIGLAWAIPAGISGGEEYRNAIFWGQSAGRMVDSFAHGRPWWWFLAVLPGLVLPWTLWPASWRALKGLFGGDGDGGIRFCLSWFLPALLVFSLISGKQLHYLLPVFPALALLLGRLLQKRRSGLSDEDAVKDNTWHAAGILIPVGFFILLGIALFTLPMLDLFAKATSLSSGDTAYWGLGLALMGAVVLLYSRQTRKDSASNAVFLTTLSTAFVVILHLSARPLFDARFDLKPISKQLKVWEESGIPLAYMGKYHGQFHFAGRLDKPVAVVGLKAPDMADWIRNNPDGRIVVVAKKVPDGFHPVYSQPYRNRMFMVVEALWARDNGNILNNL